MKGNIRIEALAWRNGKPTQAGAMIRFSGDRDQLHQQCRAERQRYESRGWEQIVTLFRPDDSPWETVIQA